MWPLLWWYLCQCKLVCCMGEYSSTTAGVSRVGQSGTWSFHLCLKTSLFEQFVSHDLIVWENIRPARSLCERDWLLVISALTNNISPLLMSVKWPLLSVDYNKAHLYFLDIALKVIACICYALQFNKTVTFTLHKEESAVIKRKDPRCKEALKKMHKLWKSTQCKVSGMHNLSTTTKKKMALEESIIIYTRFIQDNMGTKLKKVENPHKNIRVWNMMFENVDKQS